ncbi:vWA domain-containing protein [Deinococcus radiophilus]|uniref:VWA domain-containing protein n=1 Tax=Deinococcus radiophilus TaxID=32062 RepID=A0A431VL17_9DEIO|nr:VWA domain-containing protein [Deinococcus radiophilus]RTR21611.1 VWA domain-containing protein [Deinococcus radiophilus]UFA51891.1 VWA domain-containing protein [Deinococcus radiophilus]
MRKLLSVTVIACSALLASCNTSTGSTPTEPAATTGTVNGVRVVDNNTYQVGFTPLNGNDIVSNAVLKSVTVSDLSAGQATATICGQVQAQDVITTSISLDSTGSMADNDPQELRRAAAERFFDRMSAADRAAVLSFDGSTAASDDLLASKLWQGFTSDKTLLKSAVDKATFVGGGTPVFDAVIDGCTLVHQSGGQNGKVLILSDGEDNWSYYSVRQVIETANKNGTPVYAIGLDVSNNVNFRDLEDITAGTGGLFQKAGDAKDLEAFFDRMYNALRAQGCIQLSFTGKPASGTVVTGNFNVVVEASGKAPATVKAPFTVTVR